MEPYLLLFAFACLGGWFSRMCGGGVPRLPRVPELGLYGAGFAVPFLGGPLAFLAWVVGAALKATSHVPYIFLGHDGGLNLFDDKPWFDRLVTLLFGPYDRGQYWRNVFGLFIAGVIPSLPAAVVYGIVYGLPGAAVIAAGGALKPLGYMLGWYLHDKKETENANIYGEFLAGFFGWGAVGLTLL